MLGERKDITLAVVAAVVAFAVILSGAALYESAALSPMPAYPPGPISNDTKPTPTGNYSLVALTLESALPQSPEPGSVVCGGTLQSKNAVKVGMPGGPAAPFSPQNLTVVIGVNNTVSWTNNDPKGIPHTVTSNSGLFNSGDLSGPFTCTFMLPGTYFYHCIYHPLMVGAVIVKSS